MTQLKGTGIIVTKKEKTMGEYTNYDYEIRVTGKPNKAGIAISTDIRFSAYKDFGGDVNDRVAFEAELRPYNKKDGTGTFYLFSLMKLAVLENKEATQQEEAAPQDTLDDDINGMF